jgi:hypothetical protein
MLTQNCISASLIQSFVLDHVRVINVYLFTVTGLGCVKLYTVQSGEGPNLQWVYQNMKFACTLHTS